MRRVRTYFISVLVPVFLLIPAAAVAAPLTNAQSGAIVGLLRAFGVDTAVIARVESLLGASVASAVPEATDPVTPPASAQSPHVPVVDSVYPSSAIGYDLSFGTTAYPVDRFGFAVVGVNRGKAFVHNPRLTSEYDWAHFASAVSPTIYMNINGPYGSTVTGHLSAPKDCSKATSTPASDFAPTAASRGTGEYPEPSTCEAYNYGYNAAKDAYGYAQSSKAGADFWWLDVEEANSWSANPAVNDAVIQGALDYLNAQGVEAGIYSVPYMWREIAGTGFTPVERVNGTTFSVPTWFPIGIATQVGATNACNTETSFIPGSPIWILQYELDHTAVDQNIAC